MGDSVTRWIEGAKNGDEEAARALWNHYHKQIVGFARRKLPDGRRRVSDEEDVALSVFKSFFLAARDGRFPELRDREGLWKLLIKMTVRKAVDFKRHEGRLKRRVVGESVLETPQNDDQSDGLSQFDGGEPTPEFVVLMADRCRWLLESLGDQQLRDVTMAKLEGLRNEEIADRLGCSQRTIQRQLHLIRKKWELVLEEEREP